MRDFVDFVKDIIKDGYQEVYKQDIGDEQVRRHGYRCDPSARDTLGIVHIFSALRVDLGREHLTI